MSERTPGELARLIVDDIRHGGGVRVRRWVRTRTRRARERSAAWRSRDLGIAYPVAFGPSGCRLIDALRAHRGAPELRLMFGGDPGSSSRIVHVEQEQLTAFLELVSTEATAEVIVRRTNFPDVVLDERQIRRLAAGGRSFELLVVERVVGTTVPHRWCSRILVAVWKPGRGPYGSEYLQSDQQLALVGRLSPSAMRHLAARRHDFDDDGAAPGQPRFPIDVVYTWVDGSDLAWSQAKRRYAQAAGQELPDRVVHEERFRSRDELRYSLRSLELFAPWVRTVFIVTAGQTPAWLDTSHPKVRLVSHEEIYRDPAWLPTFNSSGIETQLHHIDGLARHFLYFNDDFLLGQLTDPADFFLPNGVLRFFPSEQRVYVPDVGATSEEYIQADRNAVSLFEPILDEVGRSIMRHVPYPSDRDLLAEMEERWPGEFAECAAARFRSPRDLRPIAFMQYHYGFASGRAVPSDITHRYLALWKPGIIDQLDATVRQRAWKTICVNDVGLEAERTEVVDRAVAAFLTSYFPARSAFELDAVPGERSGRGRAVPSGRP